MTLIDRAIIFVRSGKGGDGCVSLRREKFVPKGGPDGGDGGRGGDVILRVDPSLDTLLTATHRPHFRARHGQPGRGSSMHGADGEDCIVPVPPGTLVYDEDTGELLADLCDAGDEMVAARGGRGGFGNEHFKGPTNQTPRTATPGEPYEERTLRLELKLIADVGLIGLPNAGKSTLLAAITAARPRIADYPFTTLSPNLGIVELSGERRMLVADIPGLIEGAAQGAGLGHDFLRHIERTTLLLHLVEIQPLDGSDPSANYRVIRRELETYDSELDIDLASKPEIIVLTKVDLVAVGSETPGFCEMTGPEWSNGASPQPDETLEQQVAEFRSRANIGQNHTILAISSATRAGLVPLLEACWIGLGRSPAPAGWNAPQ